MKKREVTAVYEARISDLRKSLELLERQKEKFVTDVYRIRKHPKMAESERRVLLRKYLSGRSYEDWVDYFDDHMMAVKSDIKTYRDDLHRYSIPDTNPWMGVGAIAAVLLIISLSFVFLRPQTTGLTSIEVAREPDVEKAVEINSSKVIEERYGQGEEVSNATERLPSKP